jgi:hypothetical protein
MSDEYRRSNGNSKMVEQMVLQDISIYVKDMEEILQTMNFQH